MEEIWNAFDSLWLEDTRVQFIQLNAEESPCNVRIGCSTIVSTHYNDNRVLIVGTSVGNVVVTKQGGGVLCEVPDNAMLRAIIENGWLYDVSQLYRIFGGQHKTNTYRNIEKVLQDLTNTYHRHF